MIPDLQKERIRRELAEKMEKPVKIVVFTQQLECKFCAETRMLIQEFASLNEKIQVEVYDFAANADKAKEFDVDKIPSVAIIGEKDYGVRFYGFPYGFEFKTLLDGVVNVSKGKTDLSDKTKDLLKQVKTPVKIQVFVTLTCPHCAAVATTAYKFAIENELIRTDVVDASEFPHLGTRYLIMAVPKTVINEKTDFIGELPEDLFAEQVLLATAS